MAKSKKFKYPKDTNHKDRVERGRILSLDKWWGALVLRHGRVKKKRLPKDKK